jgi:hypothetical protein
MEGRPASQPRIDCGPWQPGLALNAACAGLHGMYGYNVSRCPVLTSVGVRVRRTTPFGEASNDEQHFEPPRWSHSFPLSRQVVRGKEHQYEA